MGTRRLGIAFLVASAAAVALVALLLLPGERAVVIPEDGELVQARAARDEVRFAVAPVLSPESTFDSFRILSGWLARELDQPVRLVVRRTYEQINDLLAGGHVDFAIVCSGAFVEAVHEGVELDPMLIPIHPNGPVYYSLIVARADSEWTDFAHVAGAGRLAFADPLSLTGHHYPVALARQEGLDVPRMLGEVVYTYSHHDSIYAVLDGIADAAAVDSHVFEYELHHKPEVVPLLRVVHRSPPFGIQPVVSAPHVGEELERRFQQALVGIGDTYEERRLLAELGIGGFTAPPPDLWDRAMETYLLAVEEGS